MAYTKEFDNTNTGILFKNKEKKSDKSPDFSGTLNIDGVEIKLSGWKAETKAGPALRLKVAKKNAADAQVQKAAPVKAPSKQSPAKDDGDLW